MPHRKNRESLMLTEFLLKNQSAILELTQRKTLELAGDHPTSDQLERGLPLFYRQIVEVIGRAGSPRTPPARDLRAIANAADLGDEPAMAIAAGQPLEAEVARSAGVHGFEMLRLGYTLSHVVHAYGAMCQAITEVATEKDVPIEADEFHALNRCLDVAIAGAVTDYQSRKDSQHSSVDGRGRAEEMQRLIVRVKIAFQALQRGTVGAGGNTAQVMASDLDRLEKLIEQSLVDGDAVPQGGTGLPS
jgi:hypothetical protein